MWCVGLMFQVLAKSNQKQDLRPLNKPLTYDKNIPLAEFMRPLLLEDLVGHTEIFGAGSMLHSVLTEKKIPNMILWGPPGCGKVLSIIFTLLQFEIKC